MTIKAVLFDMDGLMFDTESLSRDGFITAAKKQNYEMTKEEAYLVLGFTREAIYNFYEEYFRDKGVDGKKLVDDQFEYLENVLFTTGPAKMPYLVDLLRYLKKKSYKIAVASSSDIHHIKNNLAKTDVEKYIDVIASGEEVKNGKPAPDVFLLAAERLGVQVNECLVLEDSIFGIEAAYRAKIKAIMIPDSVLPDEKTKRYAYKILPSLREVVTFLEKEELRKK